MRLRSRKSSYDWACWSERCEAGRDLGFLRQRAEEARIDDGIHDLRKLRKAIGQTRGGAQHEGDQRNKIGILPQQRKQPPATVEAGQEAIESEHGRVGIGGAGELMQQQGYDLGKPAAREFAFQRRVSAGAPAPHESGHFKRLAKSQLGEPVERFLVVGLRGKLQSRMARLDARRILEQRRIMALHNA